MIKESLISQFHMSSMVLKANVGDVTHEESLIQPKPAGNCLNWVLGHMVAVRSNFLRGLGSTAGWTEEECKKYDRQAPALTDPAEAKPLAEIWKALDETGSAINDFIEKLSPEQLNEKAPFSPMNNPNETIGSLLTVFSFHDAYHAGQSGVLRRIIGRPPANL